MRSIRLVLIASMIALVAMATAWGAGPKRQVEAADSSCCEVRSRRRCTSMGWAAGPL